MFTAMCDHNRNQHTPYVIKRMEDVFHVRKSEVALKN